MALTNEDLQAIAGLLVPIHKRLEKIEERLDQVEGHLDEVDKHLVKLDEGMSLMSFRQNHMTKKFDNLRLDMQVMHRDTRQDIHALDDQMETVIGILQMNGLAS